MDSKQIIFSKDVVLSDLRINIFLQSTEISLILKIIVDIIIIYVIIFQLFPVSLYPVCN